MAKFNFGNNAGKRNKRDAGDAGSDGSEFAGSNAGNPIDPDNAVREATSDAGTNDGSAGSAEPVATPKRRGRPPGSRNKGTSGGSGGAKKVSSNLNGIEKTLVSLHLIAATITSVPELALEDAEAAAIAEAISNVNDHYSIPGIDEGPAAIVMLVGTLLAIYGKRYVILRAKKTKSSKPANEKSGDESNVAPFPSTMGAPAGSLFGLGA